MGAPKHTAGPWVADDAEIGCWGVFEGSEGGVVAMLTETDQSAEQDRANARLIASAPELLRALNLILPLAKGYAPDGQTATARSTCNSWIQAAEAAIAQAEGRE